MPLSEYSADLLATAEANGTAYQGPASVYLGLATSSSEPGTEGTEIVGDGYARVEYLASDYANDGTGGLSNTSDIVWPEAEEDWGTALEVIAFTAAVDGDFLWYEVLQDPVPIATSQSFTIDAGVLIRQAV